MAVNPNIKKKADDIRNKVYGKEVRESLASGLEAMSSDVVETVGRQDEVESQFQDVIDNTTGKDIISAPEIIAARDGEANLKARLDKEKNEVNTQLDQMGQSGLNAFVEKISNGEPVEVETWGDSTYAREDGLVSKVFQRTVREYYHNNALTVVNKGLSGDGTNNRIITWDSDMHSSNADIIYMNYCINDAKGSNSSLNPKIDGFAYKNNLIEMVRIARKHNKIIVMETPNPATKNNSINMTGVPEEVKNFAQIMRDVALEYNVPLVDNFKLLEKYLKGNNRSVKKLLPDGYHPSIGGLNIKGRNMAIPFITSFKNQVNNDAIINSMDATTRVYGDELKVYDTQLNGMTGYSVTVRGINSRIITPVLVSENNIDIYISVHFWDKGSKDVDVIINGEKIGNIDLNPGNVSESERVTIDREILIKKDADVGLHLVELVNKSSYEESSLSQSYIRTRLNHKRSSGNEFELSRPVEVVEKITMINKTTAISDINTSHLIGGFSISLTANFDKGCGFFVLGGKLTTGRPMSGFSFFLSNSSGHLRISEGTSALGYHGGRDINAIDMSNEERTYEIEVSKTGLCKLYVDGVSAGEYQLEITGVGGSFGLLDTRTSGANREVTVKNVCVTN